MAALAAPMLAGEVRTKTLPYRIGETDFRATYAWDSMWDGPRPAVLVVPNWLGPSDYFDERAREIVRALDFAALVVDMYGVDVRPGNQDEAAEASGEVSGEREVMRARMAAALELVRRQSEVDGARVAAIGYCFGGACVLELARMGADVKGVVSFHGSIKPAAGFRARKGNIPAKVLALHGDKDPFVPEDHVQAFREEMNAAEADYQLHIFRDAVHSFTNPNEGIPGKAEYHKPSAVLAWGIMEDFLEWNLTPGSYLERVEGHVE